MSLYTSYTLQIFVSTLQRVEIFLKDGLHRCFFIGSEGQSGHSNTDDAGHLQLLI